MWNNNNNNNNTETIDFEETSNFLPPPNSCFDTSDKNKTSTIFSMDREHLEVIRQELANNNNSQDSEDCDESSQEGNDNDSNEKEKKLAEIERDILHKSYGKIKQGDDKNGGGEESKSKNKLAKYPA